MKSALVVLSGGQDSTTCLAWAKRTYDQVVAVTFDYGQRHRLEIEAARRVACLYNTPHEVVAVGPLLRGRSPLTDPNQSLELYENHTEMEKIIGERVELTFVPMRNAFFLTLAANIAIVKDIRTLVTGVCEADNANYPDCRTAFIMSQQETINKALGIDDFHIATPLLTVTKPQSVKLMHGYGLRDYATLAFTHTAYDGVWPPTGKDHASVLRAHGFEQAGMPDPLVVRAWIEGAMPLPPTPNYVDVDEALIHEIKMLASELWGLGDD